MILRDWINNNKNKINYVELYYLLKNLFETEILDENIQLSLLMQKSLDTCLQLRMQNLPLAKILHHKWFYNDCFITTKDTLDPRPETEFIIEKIQGTPRSILDLGTGTGCLILSIVKKFYKAKGIGIDISDLALDVARCNAKLLDLERKVDFRRNNWAYGLEGSFDLIVSNPPYVSKELPLSAETLSDPELALFGSMETYLDLKNSLKDITFRQLLLEVPDYLKDPVGEIFKEYGNLEFYNVYDTGIYILSIKV